MIELRSVAKVYPARRQPPVCALRAVSVRAEKGEFITITGRSGAGKTTLLSLIAGLTRPSSGQVFFAGADLWSLTERQRSHLRNQKIGFIFQYPSLVPSLTAAENVALPAAFGPSGNEAGAMRRARELLGLTGLEEKWDAYPRQLSAGQQQRVVIARSLINMPEVLLADEPTSNLDERTEEEILAMLCSIHEQMGITTLLVAHDQPQAIRGMRTLEMADGAIIG